MNLPAIIQYTDDLPDNVGGQAFLCKIQIKNKYKDDLGILMHEREHVKQWYVGLGIGAISALLLALSGSEYSVLWPLVAVLGAGLHPLTYTLVEPYRLWSEVAAYKVQAKYYNDDRRHLFASFIANNYGLSVPIDNIELKLREGL